MSFFYEKFKNQTDNELLEKVNNPSGFQEDAVIAAIDLLIERGIELSDEQLAIRHKIEENQKQEKLANKPTEISKGRSRFYAFFLDLVVLAASSYAIGFLLMYLSLADEFITLGVSTVLIVGYFSIGNSKIFNGATFGKRQLNLSVVNSENQLITLKHSIQRSLLLIGPFFIFEFLSKIEISFWSFDILFSTLRMSYFIAIIFFVLADNNLKRSYHDLLQNTIVVKNQKSHDLEIFPKKYLWYYAGIVLVVLMVNIAIDLKSPSFETTFDEDSFEQLQTALDKNTEVLAEIVDEIDKLDNIAKINGVKIHTTNNTHTDFIIDIQTKINPLGVSGDKLANKVYGKVKGKPLQLERLDNIQVIMRYGFTMTLAKYNAEKTKNYEP